MKHTPGPWIIFSQLEKNGRGSIMVTTKQYPLEKGWIASVQGNHVGPEKEEAKANANLIAAAPDFFEAIAGDPDLLDQPIDWISALLEEYNILREKSGIEHEDTGAESLMRTKVQRFISDCQKAIAKATKHDKK